MKVTLVNKDYVPVNGTAVSESDWKDITATPIKGSPISRADWDKVLELMKDGVKLSANPKKKQVVYNHLLESFHRNNPNPLNPICVLCGTPITHYSKIGICTNCRISLATHGKVRTAQTAKHFSNKGAGCEVCGMKSFAKGLCARCYKLKKKKGLETNEELYYYRKEKRLMVLPKFMPGKQTAVYDEDFVSGVKFLKKAAFDDFFGENKD